MIPIVTGVLGVLISLTILMLIRRDKLHAHHGVFWFGVAAVFALLGLAPDIFDHIARFLHIAYPPVLALAVAIGLMVIKLLLMDLEHSRLKLRNERLIQEVAMLDLQLRQLRMQGEEDNRTGSDGGAGGPADTPPRQ